MKEFTQQYLIEVVALIAIVLIICIYAKGCYQIKYNPELYETTQEVTNV